MVGLDEALVELHPACGKTFSGDSTFRLAISHHGELPAKLIGDLAATPSATAARTAELRFGNTDWYAEAGVTAREEVARLQTMAGPLPPTR